MECYQSAIQMSSAFCTFGEMKKNTYFCTTKNKMKNPYETDNHQRT